MAKESSHTPDDFLNDPLWLGEPAKNQPVFSNQQEEGKPSSSQWGFKKRGIVWYTARTHSQLAQTVAEVRRCDIRGLQVRVMGARDQLCINQEVLSEKDSYIKVN